MNKGERRVVFLTSVGGLLEFYDFVIYALFAPYIATVFFPPKGGLIDLVLTFSAYAVGYLARPIGGLIFGHCGDRYGRKKTFATTVLVMALSTFCMGLIPSYASIGVAAPLLLTFLRICQGFSLGGEIPGATTYVSEVLPARRGLSTALVFSVIIFGIFLAGLVQMGVMAFCTKAQINSWGWRIPFLLGGVLGVGAYHLRKKLIESPAFDAETGRRMKSPCWTVLKSHRPQVVIAFLLTAVLAVNIVGYFLFVPAYVMKILKHSSQGIDWVNTFGIVSLSVVIVLVGWLSDRMGRARWFALGCLLTVGLSWVIFQSYIKGGGQYILPLALGAVIEGLIVGAVPAMLTELFPTSIRYSGIGVSYNLAFAIFGGLSPLIIIGLIEKTGNLIAPAYFLSAMSLLGLIALLGFRKLRCISSDRYETVDRKRKGLQD